MPNAPGARRVRAEASALPPPLAFGAGMSSLSVPAVRDALALGSQLLDRSDELFRDADFTVRVLEARLERSGAALGAAREAASDGQSGQAALAALRAHPLAATLASCEAAAATLRELQANRASVVDARREALAARTEAMQRARDELVAGIQAQMAKANVDLLRDLRAIVGAGAGGAGGAGAGADADADASDAAPAAPVPESPEQPKKKV